MGCPQCGEFPEKLYDGYCVGIVERKMSIGFLGIWWRNRNGINYLILKKEESKSFNKTTSDPKKIPSFLKTDLNDRWNRNLPCPGLIDKLVHQFPFRIPGSAYQKLRDSHTIWYSYGAANKSPVGTRKTLPGSSMKLVSRKAWTSYPTPPTYTICKTGSSAFGFSFLTEIFIVGISFRTARLSNRD